MAPTQQRYVVAGKTLRFYSKRAEAIGVANQMTRAFERQFRAVHARDHGWLVLDVVNKVYYDTDGALPVEAVSQLTIRG